jgi:hypothetical protein
VAASPLGHTFLRTKAILRCIYEQGAHDHHHHPVPTVKLTRMHSFAFTPAPSHHAGEEIVSAAGTILVS